MDRNDQISLNNLQIKPSDLELLSDYFSIIHHTPGRIRLRASLKLKNLAQESKIEAKELMDKLPTEEEINLYLDIDETNE